MVNIEPRICCACGSGKTYIDSDGNEHWSKGRDEKNEWTGKWLCNTCRMNTEKMKKYYKKRYDDIKHVTDCRNARIDIKRDRCRGCIGVRICAKVLNVNMLDIEMDNFRYYVDLSDHLSYGYSEVKTATLNIRDGRWYFNKIHKENFDTILLVCMDQYEIWKDVVRVYAIPSDKITTATTITVYLNPSRKVWYERFEIDIKPFNDTYHNMDIDKCPTLEKKN